MPAALRVTEHVLQQRVQGVSHRNAIRAPLARQPALSNEQVNFGLAQFDRDAPQTVSTSAPVQGHASGAGRLYPDLGWQIVRPAGHGISLPLKAMHRSR
jgi:hypothetical protein